jgi:hypothetical protein
VIQDVKERSREAQEGGHLAGLTLPQETDADSKADDADVLDAAIRETPLQILLRQGVQDSDETGERSDDDQRRSPPRLRPTQKGQSPQQPIDPDLDHHARHESGHVARRGRMCVGQPDVQGPEAGLGSEPHQRQQEVNVREARSSAVAKNLEVVGPGRVPAEKSE